MSTRCSSHVLPGAKGMLPSAMMGESMSSQSAVLSFPSPSSMIPFVLPSPGRDQLPGGEIGIVDAFLGVRGAGENVVCNAVAVAAVFPVRLGNGLLRPGEIQVQYCIVIHGKNLLFVCSPLYTQKNGEWKKICGYFFVLRKHAHKMITKNSCIFRGHLI